MFDNLWSIFPFEGMGKPMLCPGNGSTGGPGARSGNPCVAIPAEGTPRPEIIKQQLSDLTYRTVSRILGLFKPDLASLYKRVGP